MIFSRPPRRPGQSAFTLVEIAICLAIIVFGLVAVIGVLPLGMNVQKDNREETIIGQDAEVFIDAIRHGNRGLDDLTNYLVAVTNYVYHFDVVNNTTNLTAPPDVYGFTTSNSLKNGSPEVPGFPLTNGMAIVGLLSTPRYIPDTNNPGSFYSNYVFADFRALNGPLGDKFPQKDERILDFAFAYRLIPEISPVATLESTSVYALTFRTNLHELRLQFRWPLLVRGVGNNRLSYRTQLGGTLVHVPDPNNTHNLYYFDPNALTSVPPPPP